MDWTVFETATRNAVNVLREAGEFVHADMLEGYLGTIDGWYCVSALLDTAAEIEAALPDPQDPSAEGAWKVIDAVYGIRAAFMTEQQRIRSTGDID